MRAPESENFSTAQEQRIAILGRINKTVRIHGRLLDVTGASVGDATVVLKLVESGNTTATTKTTETGEYTLGVAPHRSYDS